MITLDESNEIENFWFIHLDDIEIGSFGISGRYEWFPWHLFSVEIYQPYRGFGYGQTALQLLIKLWGNKPLRLHVHPDNERARHIYEKLGFVYDDKFPYFDYLHMELK